MKSAKVSIHAPKDLLSRVKVSRDVGVGPCADRDRRHIDGRAAAAIPLADFHHQRAFDHGLRDTGGPSGGRPCRTPNLEPASVLKVKVGQYREEHHEA